MLLNELKQGARFMFADRSTPIALANKSQHATTGIFIYVKPDASGYPTLKHLDTGKELTAIAVTYFRSVLTNV